MSSDPHLTRNVGASRQVASRGHWWPFLVVAGRLSDGEAQHPLGLMSAGVADDQPHVRYRQPVAPGRLVAALDCQSGGHDHRLPPRRHGFWYGIGTGMASVWHGHSSSPSRRSGSAVTTRHFRPTWMYLTVPSRHVLDRRFRPVLARLLLRSSGRCGHRRGSVGSSLRPGRVHFSKPSEMSRRSPCAGADP